MKLLFVLLFSFCVSSVFAQRAVYKNDTLSYKERRFVVGDTVNVSYGSGADGKFVFIYMGSGIGGVTPMESNFSKSQVRIDKIYKSGGRLLVRGKVLESSVNIFGGNKVFIEPEGAIDKKEVE
jgi:hypothetical protein